MYFYAVCPHCRDAELQVPERKRGTVARCPKCGKDFPLQPGGRSKYDAVPEPAAPAGKRTRAKASATVPVAERAAAKPSVAVETAAPDAEPASDSPWDAPTVIALVAFGLFGPGMIATQFPYGRFVALPFLIVGALAAAASLLGLDKRAWLGWAGLGLNAVGLVLVIALPGWLGASTWLPPVVATSTPKVPVAVDRTGKTRPADWVDASQGMWQMEDVRVAVSAAALEPVPPAGKEYAVRVRLRVINAGLEKPVEFAGWSPAPSADKTPPPPTPVLTAGGVALALRPPGPPDPVVAIHPGQSADAALAFAAPTKPGDLKLELPAHAFGGKEPARFVIPWAMLTGRDRFPVRSPKP